MKTTEQKFKAENSVNANDALRANPWYQVAAGTAVVAGVFSVIVCTLLVLNYLEGKPLEPSDPTKKAEPLKTEELAKLKTQLLSDPQNKRLIKDVRQLDLQLREEFFHRQSFAEQGKYLLLGGIVVFLIGIKTAAGYRKQPPGLRKNANEQALANRNANWAFWSASVLGVVVGGVALLSIVTDETVPTSQLLKDIIASQPGTEKDTAVAVYPSTEDIKRNWPRFRGPGGLGISAYTNVPSYWDEKSGEGIVWKSEVSLPGENSPIVWDGKVFLTGADEQNREVYCFDGTTGKLLWQRAVNVPRRSSKIPDVMEDTGFAAPTAATDGQRVYAIFANGDVICFDFAGNRVWGRNLGIPDSAYGYATSLTMYRNLLLVQYDQATEDDGLSEMLALDGGTGQPVWRKKRPVANSWASPIVIDTGKDRQLITCAEPWVISYDPATGDELWQAKCLYGDVAPSQIYSNGLVLAVRPGEELIAIGTGGRGNVTESQIAWIAEDDIPDICSPVSNGKLVFLATNGTVICYEVKDGTKVWTKESDLKFEASPSLVGDKVYLVSNNGTAIIIEAGLAYKEIARCRLDEAVKASPAFADGRIYIRGEKHLYCIGNKE